MIFRQPPLSAVANIFVLPFEIDVWICICILMLVVFVIMLLQLWHPILQKLAISNLDVGSFIWGAVCQQSTHLQIPTTSGRIVVFTAFFATLALFTSYSASIVALLQSPSNFIKSLDDLIASPIEVGMHEAGYARFIVHANYSGVREVYERKVQPQGEKGWIYDPFVGIERVRTELFAFQVDSPSAYKAIGRTFTESEKCSLSELQMIILPRTTILVERNSGYKELIRQRLNEYLFIMVAKLFKTPIYRMKWQKEVGLMKRDEIKWIPKKPDCEGGQRGFMTVGLREIKPAAFLLLIGYGSSVCIFVIEILYRKTYERCTNSKKNRVRKQNKKREQNPW